jgi:radical SAM protein with 4Fe4S-binding SPASM domain
MSFYELDPVQTRVIELCDGTLSQAEIVARIGGEFGFTPIITRQQVQSAFDLFDRYFSLNWRKQPKLANNRDTRQMILPPGPPAFSAPLYVLWDITYACNLRCKHCLADAGSLAKQPQSMNLEEVKKLLHQLVDLRVFYLNFVGGEPFVRKDMLDILEYASSLPLGIIITTNGLLINDALVERLQGLNIFDLQISIDGLEGTHDAFRGLPGSYNKALQAVRKLSQAGFRITVNSVMTQWNCHELEALVELAYQSGASTYKAVAFLPVGRGKKNAEKLILKPIQLKKNNLRLKALKKKYADKINVDFEENYPLENEPAGETKLSHLGQIMGCAAGISQLVIDPYGKVFSCPFLHELPVGDIKNQSLAEIWCDSYILNVFRNIDKGNLKGKCHGCPQAGIECRGGCRASAFAVKGDLWDEDPLCWQSGSHSLKAESHL